MPRLLLNVISAVANKVPPLSTKEPTVTKPGIPPRLRSVLMDKVPAKTVMVAACVLVPEKVTVPALPSLPIVNKPEPLTTPEIASVAPVPAEIVPPPAPTTIAVVVAGPFDEPLVAELVNVPLFKLTMELT